MAWAVRISGDGGQEGRHLEKKGYGPTGARCELLASGCAAACLLYDPVDASLCARSGVQAADGGTAVSEAVYPCARDPGASPG